jgi:hypothetical protein
MSFRRSSELEAQENLRLQSKKTEQFMDKIYRTVTSHRDSEAILLLIDRYDYFQTSTRQLEELFKHIEKWGPSRTLLCLGRLVIYRLTEEKRYGRSLFFIEKCQQISPQFILPELIQTVFYATLAYQNSKPELAYKLIKNAESRYGDLVNIVLCKELEGQLDGVNR